MFFSNENISLPKAILNMALDLIKTLVPAYLQGLISQINETLIVNVLKEFKALFVPTNSALNVIDKFLFTKLCNNQPYLVEILNPFNKLISNTILHQYLPSIIPHLLKSYKELLEGIVSLQGLLDPLTPHAELLNENLGILFTAALDAENITEFYNSWPASFLDLKETLNNIMKWEEMENISIKDIIDIFVVTTSDAKLLEQDISLLDIIPLQFWYQSIKDITEAEKRGEYPILKAMNDILNYNISTIQQIGKYIHYIVFDKSLSLENVVNGITKSKLSLVIDEVVRIMTDISDKRILSLESLNTAGLIIAKDVAMLPEPTPIVIRTPTKEIPTSVQSPTKNPYIIEENVGANPQEATGITTSGIVGIVIAVAFVAVVGIYVVFVFAKKRSKENNESNGSEIVNIE